MSETNHLTLTIDDTSYEVTVDRFHRFQVVLPGGGTEHGSTWEEMAEAAKKRIRRGRVTVEVPFYDEVSKRHGVAYQLHAGSGNVMVRWADGSRTQVAAWRDVKVLAPDVDTDRLAVLTEAYRSAERELQRFREEHRLVEGDLDGAVKAAITRITGA